MFATNRFRVMALKSDFSNTNKKYKEALMYYGYDNSDLLSQNIADVCPMPILKYSRTLSKQSSLPRLPVPILEMSINKYLMAIKPLLNELDFDNTKKIAADFSKNGGVGEKLQKLLVERSKSTENWMAQWWLDKIYLEPRYNIPINVSPGSLYPKASYTNLDEKLSFVTKYIYGFMEFKKNLDDQMLPTEKLGESNLCMDQYYKLIGTCRIPRKDKDEIKIMQVYKMSLEKMNHIIVMFNNRIFSLKIIDPNTGLSFCQEEIFNSLKSIVQNSTDKGIGLGILTADDRDIWADTYDKLCKNQTNKDNFEIINNSLFVVCLDNNTKNTVSDLCQDVRSVSASHILHGNKEFTANRFFDKTIQAIFGDNGVWGVCFEHSVAEAVPHAFMNDFIYNYIKSTVDETVNTSYNESTGEINKRYQELKFNIQEEIQNQIIKSNLSVYKFIDNLDLFIMSFDAFGKNFPKSQKISPDAFVQLAMQLAFYRFHNKLGNTYESASLRKFHLGRTEIIRTCSSDAEKFVKSMPTYDLNNNSITNTTFCNKERAELLLKAINSHRLYTNNAINCLSFDRHLLGLKLISIENNMELDTLYKDIGYQKACHYHISSSQVSSKYDAVTCYGPAVPDGYGACYNITEKKIFFGISSNNSCHETSSKKFAGFIQMALIDCQNLLLKVNHKL